MAENKGKGNAFKSLPASLKPREQMEMLGTARGMSPEALLAILLKTGTSGCDVTVAAKRFLAVFQSVGEMIRCDWKGLMAKIAAYNRANPQNPVRGIGKVKCMELAAAFELVRIAYETPHAGELPQVIETSADAAKWFRARMRFGDDREHFFVLPLDAAHKPISQAICVSSGLLNGTPAGAREVFAQAVQWQAAAIVVAHNHPSGDPTPSQKDVALTQELIDASKILRIPLLDHIIIGKPDSRGGQGFVSIRSLGGLNF